ncbi:hypothetical protein BKA65DRAFT_115212 [Rhexocercosporidium sp. MPI-PUGE-AT-0058]|nr:hypothetical protein BKA65DRAFT_115212 [Rhexocercosporidium sp. MPI-PUGE-AT-0058]
MELPRSPIWWNHPFAISDLPGEGYIPPSKILMASIKIDICKLGSPSSLFGSGILVGAFLAYRGLFRSRNSSVIPSAGDDCKLGLLQDQELETGEQRFVLFCTGFAVSFALGLGLATHSIFMT